MANQFPLPGNPSLLNKLKEPSNLLNTMDTLGTISDLIRFVQTDNSQIHTMFWNRVLVLLQDQPSMGFLIFFSSRYIKRYLFQNNFRNYQFEEFIKKSMWSELDCASPKHLVFYATIILKLSPSYVKTRIPNVLFSKLVDNIDQLCLLSCFVLMDALVVMLNVADSDEILTQLKSCNSVQQVFDIFAANKNSFTSKHLCQAILVLRDIQKVFNKFYLDDFTKNITEQKYETGIGESHHSVFHVFQRELTSHERFKELLSRINEECDNFDIDEAVCTMLYLQYLGVHLKHKTIQRLFAKIPPERMSSRLIYAACRHIIIHSEHYTPAHALLDKCVRYCEDNSDVIIGLVVSYVLYSCYLVSYPLHTQHPKFLDIASRILLRDKDSVKRLVLIRSSLALAYYNSLPHSLTEHIFSLNFLEYLDEEMCTTSSQSLTLKIRNDLMELNRAVCLDYAQFGIPWFHQKYVRQLRISAQQNSSYSKFHNDVRDVLVHYVGDPQLVLTNVTSPYGQKIDFVLCLDKLGNPVPFLILLSYCSPKFRQSA
ncbi:uncharacterized protein LOC103520812 [Diaphorina citri]|uniref:Uncharacterized protein LOC103520812 n=1 Tax=Diaphorina citri TaxID=121845 RepID=A0A3Q0JGL9_DIACI|nr:uncharacterized protein LOC103520812 [Diaphorina citri]